MAMSSRKRSVQSSVRSTKRSSRRLVKKKKKMRPNIPGISRIDQPEKYNHGWYVRLLRRGKRFARFFSDKQGPGKVKALASAQKYYATIAAKHPPLSRRALAQIKRRWSRTRIVGVNKIAKIVKGRPYTFWVATWTPRKGEYKTSCFSVKKYGNAQAKKMAVRARKLGVMQMED
jgi:hypothetical protein